MDSSSTTNWKTKQNVEASVSKHSIFQLKKRNQWCQHENLLSELALRWRHGDSQELGNTNKSKEAELSIRWDTSKPGEASCEDKRTTVVSSHRKLDTCKLRSLCIETYLGEDGAMQPWLDIPPSLLLDDSIREITLREGRHGWNREMEQ